MPFALVTGSMASAPFVASLLLIINLLRDAKSRADLVVRALAARRPSARELSCRRGEEMPNVGKLRGRGSWPRALRGSTGLNRVELVAMASKLRAMACFQEKFAREDPFQPRLGARTLLGAPGRTADNKKLLGTKGIATRSKDATSTS